MKHKIKVRIALDKRYLSKGTQKAPLKIEIRKDNVAALIDLNIKVDPENWDAANEKVLKPKNQAEQINLMLSELSLKAKMIVHRLQLDEKITGLSSAKIKDLVAAEMFPKEVKTNDTDKPDVTFISHYQTFMSRKTGGTRRVYEDTLSKLRKYSPDIEKLTFDEITLKWLRDFESDMSKTVSINTRSIHLRNIRAVFNDAIDEEITACYPFRKFKIKHEETRKRAMPLEELRRFINFPVDPYAEIYRDMFILIFMLIGINSVDLFNLSKISSEGRIEYRRAKTHRLYSIKVEPEALAIINKWKGKKGLLIIKDRWQDHISFRHQLNKSLRLIGAPIEEACGKKGAGEFPYLSTYWARHSWATIARKIGISKDVIAQALGHGSKTTTDIYIDEDMMEVDAANRRVLDWVLYGKI